MKAGREETEQGREAVVYHNVKLGHSMYATGKYDSGVASLSTEASSKDWHRCIVTLGRKDI